MQGTTTVCFRLTRRRPQWPRSAQIRGLVARLGWTAPRQTLKMPCSSSTTPPSPGFAQLETRQIAFLFPVELFCSGSAGADFSIGQECFHRICLQRAWIVGGDVLGIL